MGVNSLPKTITRQRRGCDLNPGPTALEFSMLTTRLPSHPWVTTGEPYIKWGQISPSGRVNFGGIARPIVNCVEYPACGRYCQPYSVGDAVFRYQYCSN